MLNMVFVLLLANILLIIYLPLIIISKEISQLAKAELLLAKYAVHLNAPTVLN